MSSNLTKIPKKLENKTIIKNGKKVVVHLDKISPKQIEYFDKSFVELDEDNTGKIGVDELILYLDNIGIKATREEIIEGYFEHDNDDDMELDFEEFVARVALREDVDEPEPEPEPEPKKEDEVVEAFKFFSEQLKYIDILHVKSVLMKTGDNKFTKEEFDEMMSLTGHLASDKFHIEDYVADWREKMESKN